MSESTLALTRSEIKATLGVQAGWGATAASWTANQTAQVDRSIKRGLRMAYFPPPTAAAPKGHEWNFLRPTTTLTIFNAVTGYVSLTPVYSSPNTTVTATAAKFFPTMIGQSITFDTSGTDYVINAYTSTTVVVVTGDASAELAATGTVDGAIVYTTVSTLNATTEIFTSAMVGKTVRFSSDAYATGFVIASFVDTTTVTLTGDASAKSGTLKVEDSFTITPTYAYRLPDDFGHMLGPFTHPTSATAYALGIQESNEGHIRRFRESSTESGPPELFAIRPVSTTGATGQRFEALFWPDVDAEYTLSYCYSVLPNALVDTTLEYPYGGAAHSEMILSACRAALDLDVNDRKGVYYDEFMTSLNASIVRDRQLAPGGLGYMGPSGDRGAVDRHRGRTTFTVNSTELLL